MPDKSAEKPRRLWPDKPVTAPSSGNLANNVAPPYAAAAAMYLLLAVALYFQLLFQPFTLSAPDALVPLVSSAALDRLYDTGGQYPLWQPWVFAGMPTVEAFSYLGGLYYPNILLSKLPLGDIGSQILHLVFSGLGGYTLLRGFRLHHIAAFVGGAAFMLNPYMTAMLVHGHGSQLMTAAYMPWMLWATNRVFGWVSFADAGMLALLAGFQLQRAHVQIAWYTWMLMGVLGLVLLVSRHRDAKESLKKIGLFVLGCSVGIGIAAAVYLPASEYAAYSVRGVASGAGAARDYATMWSMHPIELFTFLVPGLFGFGGVTYWGFMPFTDFPHYAGIAVLLLALTGLYARRHEPFVLFLGGTTLLALLISFGSFFSPVFDLFYNFAPLFSRFRVPSMVLVVVSLNLSLLAGFGLHRMLDAPERSLRFPLKAFALTGAITIAIFMVGGGLLEDVFRSLFPAPPVGSFDLAFMVNKVRWESIRQSALLSGFIAVLVAGAAWPGMRKHLSGTAFALVLAVLSIGDILLIDRAIVSPSEASLRPPVLVSRARVEAALAPDDITRYLAAQPGDFRIYPIGPLFGENKFALSGLESVGGYHPAKLKNYEEFLRRTENLSSLRALGMLNVRYIVSPAELRHADLELVRQGSLHLVSGEIPAWVYRLKATCPRAWFATTVTGVSDRDALFVRLLQQDSTGCRSVYVDGAQWQGVKRFAEGSITSVRRTAERMAMTVSAPSEAFLVTSELFYPLRWQATLDGKPVSTQEVNGLIRGVRIPAGKHELVFVYDRSDFDKGRTISLAAFGVALLMLAGGFVARRAGGSQKQEV